MIRSRPRLTLNLNMTFMASDGGGRCDIVILSLLIKLSSNWSDLRMKVSDWLIQSFTLLTTGEPDLM